MVTILQNELGIFGTDYPYFVIIASTILLLMCQ